MPISAPAPPARRGPSAARAHALPGQDLAEVEVEVTRRAEQELAGLAERLAQQGVTSEPHVNYDDAPPAIVDAAGRGPHRHGGSEATWPRRAGLVPAVE